MPGHRAIRPFDPDRDLDVDFDLCLKGKFRDEISKNTMSRPNEVVQKFQDGLDPYIKPREQVNYIRRILALHMATSAGQERATQPLSLTQTGKEAHISDETNNLYREYIEALNANVQAQKDFRAALDSNHDGSTPDQQEHPSKPDILGDRMSVLRLYKKRERLSTVRNYLDELAEKPAAAEDFLNPRQIFQDAPVAPVVPPQVMNSIAQENTSAAGDLEGRARQLEKMVLRAKMLLKKEEQYLRDAQARSKDNVNASNEARMEALSATRNELITWIEVELSKASSAETEEGNQESSEKDTIHHEGGVDTIEENLRKTKEKYAQYCAARKELLALLSAPNEQLRPPKRQSTPVKDTTSIQSIPTSHLITPYVGALLAASRRQKSLINDKSRVKAALNSHVQASGQILGHLVDESQLLPAYPMEDPTGRNGGSYDDDLVSMGSEHPDLAKKVLPWVFAADSAKIASFEAVAESIEKGQFALENSTKGLEQVRRLLGKDIGQVDKEIKSPEQEEEDFWMGTAGEEGKKTAGLPRRRANTGSKKKKLPQDSKDAWSNIHGNLGLLGQEDIM